MESKQKGRGWEETPYLFSCPRPLHCFQVNSYNITSMLQYNEKGVRNFHTESRWSRPLFADTSVLGPCTWGWVKQMLGKQTDVPHLINLCTCSAAQGCWGSSTLEWCPSQWALKRWVGSMSGTTRERHSVCCIWRTMKWGKELLSGGWKKMPG